MLIALFLTGLAAAGCDTVSEPQNSAPPASLPSAVALVVGQNSALGASTSTRTAVWYSDNPWSASVSKSGVVAALHPGAAVVTRRVAGHTDSSLVTVRALIAAVRLVTDTAGLPVGGTTAAAFHAYDTQGNEIIDVQGNSVQWSSSADSIAKIDSTGVIVALSPGAATMFLAVDGRRDSMWVRVHPQPPTSSPTNPPTPIPTPTTASVAVTLASSSLTVGSSTQAQAVAKDASGNVLSGKAVTWSSLNTATATVSSTGVVTATAAGPVSIQATIDGVNGAASLSVSAPPQAPPPQSPPSQTPPPTVAPVTLALQAGSYSGRSYALEAQTTLSGVASVQFVVDGKPYVTEWLPKYCLFGGDNPCNSGSLGVGSHTIQARAYSSTSTLIGQSTMLSITEGTPPSSSPPTTSPTPPAATPPPTTSPSSPQPTTGSLAEPVFDGTQNTMIYQTDFENYTNALLNPAAGQGKPAFVNKLYVYGTAPAGTNTSTQLVAGHNSGNAVQFQYTGTSQESPGIIYNGSAGNGSSTTPATSTSVVQYWAKVTPLGVAMTSTKRLQVKWIMLWHNDPGNNRIQFNTTTGQGGCGYNNDPRAQTKWELYDLAYTGCNALQPAGPYWNTIADGQWHRFTHLVKSNTSQGSRDGRALMWIDGVLVMRVEQSAVGVVPPGANGTSAGQPWCVQADVDNIIAGYGIGSPEFGGPLTDGSTPITIAIDDFAWWR